MRNYMKKKLKKQEIDVLVNEELGTEPTVRKKTFARNLVLCLGLLGLSLPVAFGVYSYNESKNISLSEEGAFAIASAPISATAGKKGLITIPAGTENPNPFLPYRDISGKVEPVSDVPTNVLMAPPESANAGSEAARIMDTVVSGILFDKFSPSAILNIEGSDYLVKKGDVVNNYKVESITQDSVTVKLGANVYKAGIGQILTEGNLNHNDVANLSNKFGGER